MQVGSPAASGGRQYCKPWGGLLQIHSQPELNITLISQPYLAALGPPVISSSSISKISVAPPGIEGLPWSPYARSEGQVSMDFPPVFIFCTPSVQQRITPLSGNWAGSFRL